MRGYVRRLGSPLLVVAILKGPKLAKGMNLATSLATSSTKVVIDLQDR